MAKDPDMLVQLEAQRKKVDVDNFDVTVRELIRMVESNEIDRAPEYQRKFRWDEARESKLVESVLLGLPIPTVFMATNRDGTWELVDGLQRISSLVHFAGAADKIKAAIDKDHPLVLEGLEKLSAFNGLGFADLPEPVKLHFFKRALRVTSLSDKSDLGVRFDTFERLNTGGIALSAQEIRSCVYQGALSDFLEKAAGNEELKKIIKLQRGHRDDGTLEEFVLKMFAYADRQEAFDGRVTHFLNEFARDHQTVDQVAKIKADFDSVLKKIGKFQSGPILKENYSVTPLNLAEAVFVGALRVHRTKKKMAPQPNWLKDAELLKHSTKGTNTRTALNGRISRAIELLTGDAPIVRR